MVHVLGNIEAMPRFKKKKKKKKKDAVPYSTTDQLSLTSVDVCNALVSMPP